jgi:hypothetical protein
VTSQDEIRQSPGLPTPAEQHRRALTADDRQRFLEALSNGWSVRHAAVYAGRHWRRFYTLRERDEAFAAQWAEAVEAGTDALEQEAYRRAVEGVEEPVYQGGKLVGTVRRYSDGLLQFLLRGRRREVYGDTVQVETGPVTITLQEVRLEVAPRRSAGELVDGEARELPEEATS